MKRKNNTLLSLVLPAVLCTALWGSAAPCVKKGYELFEIAAGDSFSQLVFAGWRFTLAGVLVLLVAACMGHRIRPKRGEYRAIFMISLFQSMLPVRLLLYRSRRYDRYEGFGALGHADLLCAAARTRSAGK